MVVELLGLKGYTTLAAEDGDQALASFQASSDRIAAVVLDMMMPGKDGLSVRQVLRELREDLPVVLMSGGMAPPDSLDPSCDAFLGKPFKIEDLCATIARLLESSGNGGAVTAP
jgi:CheY-like chemotaxis protein